MSSARADAAGLPRKGDILAGKYEVEDLIGRGGMGVVVAARHVALRQRVAVKFLLPSAATLPDAGERFLREAQAAAAIQSEHVARVIDVGKLETGEPFMVMEYLHGTDLSRLIAARGQLPVALAVDIILQAGEAIAEAHARGIVHRDLKPGNIFVTSRADGSPFIKVLDFGLVKIMAPDGNLGAALTKVDTVIGSPPYMSPEQLRSLRDVDPRTDLWSLGVILYLLLAGRRPFPGDSLPAVIASIAMGAMEPLSTIRPDLPAGLDQVIYRCLEKDRDLRVQSMAELSRWLAPYAPDGQASLERTVKISRGAPEVPALVPPMPQAGGEENTFLTPGPMMDVNASVNAQASTASQIQAPARRPMLTTILAAAAVFVVVLAVGLVSTRRLGASTSDAPADATVGASAAPLPAEPSATATEKAAAPPADAARAPVDSTRAPDAVGAPAPTIAAPAATVAAPAPTVAAPETSAEAPRKLGPRSPAGAPPRPRPGSADPLERWK